MTKHNKLQITTNYKRHVSGCLKVAEIRKSSLRTDRKGDLDGEPAGERARRASDARTAPRLAVINEFSEDASESLTNRLDVTTCPYWDVHECYLDQMALIDCITKLSLTSSSTSASIPVSTFSPT